MRRTSRELALQILFQREFTSQIDFDQFISMLDEPVEKGIRDYTQKLVTGVSENKDQIDQWIQTASRHWKMERMSVVDRTILRIACYEIKKLDLKSHIAIDEAGTLDKGFDRRRILVRRHQRIELGHEPGHAEAGRRCKPRNSGGRRIEDGSRGQRRGKCHCGASRRCGN